VVNGGEKVEIGMDKNRNGTLDSIEDTTIKYICNGGGSGVTGKNGKACSMVLVDEKNGKAPFMLFLLLLPLFFIFFRKKGIVEKSA